MKYAPHSLIATTLFAALIAAACSSDEDSGTADAGGGGDGGGSDGSVSSGGSGGDGGGPGSDAAGCAVTLEPTSDDAESLLGALIDAQANDVICLSPGTYHFTREVTHTGTDHVTIRGIGASRDDVVLDFAGQTEGDNAMEIQADNFTIEHLSVVDAKGDGIKITNSDFPTFRNIKATWSAGASSENGTYALYPAECNNVLIEDCEVSYAADAGIYLGQSTTGIVRRNVAFGNVIGIEVENSEDVEIYENEAYDNSCGLLIVNLPNLVRKNNLSINAHDNNVHENDHANFAQPGAFVEGVPPGSGIVVMASDDVELHQNTIEDNSGVGIIIVSWPTFSAVGGFSTDDTEYEQFSERLFLHDNTYSGNGSAPAGIYEGLFGTQGFDIAYDAAVDPALAGDGGASAEPLLCIQEAASATYYNLAAPPVADGGTRGSSDLAPHDCTFPAQATITL